MSTRSSTGMQALPLNTPQASVSCIFSFSDLRWCNSVSPLSSCLTTADNGDTTYPMKCTCTNCAPPVAPLDGSSPSNGGADAADVNGSEEGIKAPERQSTHLHAAAQAKPTPV